MYTNFQPIKVSQVSLSLRLSLSFWFGFERDLNLFLQYSNFSSIVKELSFEDVSNFTKSCKSLCLCACDFECVIHDSKSV